MKALDNFMVSLGATVIFMLGIVLLLGAFDIGPLGSMHAIPAAPKFSTGDCLQWLDEDGEETWETKLIIRVEEVGRRNYRTIFWLDEYGWGIRQKSSSEHFSNDDMYEKVACPG